MLLVDRKRNTQGTLLHRQSTEHDGWVSIYAAPHGDDAADSQATFAIKIAERQSNASILARCDCTRPAHVKVKKGDELWVSCDDPCMVWYFESPLW